MHLIPALPGNHDLFTSSREDWSCKAANTMNQPYTEPLLMTPHASNKPTTAYWNLLRIKGLRKITMDFLYKCCAVGQISERCSCEQVGPSTFERMLSAQAWPVQCQPRLSKLSSRLKITKASYWLQETTVTPHITEPQIIVPGLDLWASPPALSSCGLSTILRLLSSSPTKHRIGSRVSVAYSGK